MFARLSSLYRPDTVQTSMGVSAIATVVQRAVGFGRGVALAWLISQAQFGLFGVALLTLNVLLPLCSIGLHEGIARYAAFHEAGGTLKRFALRVCLLLAGVTAATATALWVFSEPLGGVLFSSTQTSLTGANGDSGAAGQMGLARAVACCTAALAAYHAMLGFLRGLRMFRAHAGAEVFSASLFTALAIGGAYLGFDTAESLVWSYAVSSLVTVLILLGPLIARVTAATATTSPNHSTPTPREDDAQSPTAKRPAAPAQPPGADLSRDRTSTSRLITFSLWSAATAITWHATSYFPMWYLLKVSDAAAVGTFHAVRMLTQFVQVGAVMMTMVIAGHATRDWEHRGREFALPRLALMTKLALVAILATATALSLLRPILLRLFPAGFAAGSAAYDPLLLFFLLSGAVGLIAVRLNLVEKPRLVFVAWLVGMSVNVATVFAMLGSPTSSGIAATEAIVAAAWAGCCGLGAATATVLVLARRSGVGLDLGAVILLMASLAVALGRPFAVAAMILVVVVCARTSWIITRQDFASVIERLRRRDAR
ncbi:MAG: hypothetical protein IID36_12795 [Planctomycetes bacterium]|nr:hypothetical protein [Planctomycetota bacterium]